MTQKLFARVVDNKIIEYPVYEGFILARGDPFSIYTLVQQEDLPAEVGPHQYVVSNPVLKSDGSVVLKHQIEVLPLEQLLCKAWGVDQYFDLVMKNDIKPPKVEDIQPSILQCIKAEVTKRVQTLLDEFANQHDYTNMVSLCSYYGSSHPIFGRQATIGMWLRDEVWGALFSFFQNIEKGDRPMIKSFNEVEQTLPPFSWTPVLDGQFTQLAKGQELTFTIKNFIKDLKYDVKCQTGTCILTDNIITYQADQYADEDVLTIDDATYTLTFKTEEVKK